MLTEQGPLIVHNCILGMGFGMGYLKAGAELLKGMLGAPPIQFKYDDLANLQVDPSQFLNNPYHVKAVSELTSRLELNDRLIHWCVAHALVQRYRAKMDKIVAYWRFLGDVVIPAMVTGREVTFGAHGVFRTGPELIWSPCGLPLRYRGLEVDDHGQASYFNGRERTKLHGALLCENLTQHLHRVVVAGQLLEISTRHKVALWPYDEVVCVVPETEADEALAFMLQTMKKAPPWATGLPLASEGGIGDNYSEAG